MNIISRKLLPIVMLCLFIPTIQGCSLLKSVIAPLTPVKSTLPQTKNQSTEKMSCKGQLELYETTGNVKSCSKGFRSYDKRFNEIERKLNWKEKFGQYISRASGYLIIGGGLILFFAPGVFGLIFGRFVEAGIGVGGQTLKAISRGLAKGKKYVRENGTNLSEKEKQAYDQGAKDLLKHIAEETKDPKIKKHIYKIRGETKD